MSSQPTPMIASAQAPKPIAVDVNTAAAMLGVSRNTILAEIHRGEIRAFKVGRLLRIRIAEIEAYAKRRESGGTAR